MANRTIHSSVVDLIDTSSTATIDKGGTGADNALDAVKNLGGLSVTMLDKPNGIAKVGSNGKLATEYFPGLLSKLNTVSGPLSLLVSQSASYVITNYDSFDVYVIETASGSVERTNDVIVYTAPAAPGLAGFTINGEQVIIEIITPTAAKPAIISPTNGAINITSAYTFVSNAFSIVGGSDTHEGTDWQLATDPIFDNIVQQVANDTTNKTSWPISGLLANTTYYIRTRHKGTAYGYSPWSDATSFSTRIEFIPESEEAILIASDKAAGDTLGFWVAASNDGSRVIVGARTSDPGALSDAGAAYIFSKVDNVWTQEAKLIASDKVANDYFGYSVDISADGTRAIVGAPNSDPSATSNAGAAYVFSRAGTTWTQEQKLTASDRAADDNFGITVAIDSTGTRVAIGATGKDPSAISAAGAAYVFLRSGVTWTQEQSITASDKLAGANFGGAIAISAAGDRVVVGAASHTSQTGAAYVFSRAVTTWTQEGKLIASNGAVGDIFGHHVSINNDGSVLIIGAPRTDPAGITDAGSAYIFSRSGTVWSQEEVLNSNDKASPDVFSTSVSISGDGTRVLVGSDLNSPNGLASAGAAYIFVKRAGAWSQEVKLTASDKAAGDNFGWRLALSRDGSKAFIGARYRDSGGLTDSGALYTFV